ncbi:GNAT family N-acetyltransferase [Gelidibacter sp. F63206]|uniref:GNAT family N-acetyltransferase n=1 Tax=Gelidibacter sp. F63206 TaxID=2926425 RepID=UPI001FF48D61|nr:GNAT family N-acetyltransferase [Gelidibacter sp. F63206]MCK0114877.1 GNAT family N-acetyltransferase [Gelidibacter sp. F63206]
MLFIKNSYTNLIKVDWRLEIFETKRLVVRGLKSRDKINYIELLSDPEIINPIPQARLSESQILDKFYDNLNLKWSDLSRSKYTCGIFEKGNPEMIGLCLFLTNDENDKELGYRFRSNYWGKGYGTEIAKGMIDHYFNSLNVDRVAADVNTKNIGSAKILEKFMKPMKEFFNQERHCRVRRYIIEKSDWIDEQG